MIECSNLRECEKISPESRVQFAHVLFGLKCRLFKWIRLFVSFLFIITYIQQYTDMPSWVIRPFHASVGLWSRPVCSCVRKTGFNLTNIKPLNLWNKSTDAQLWACFLRSEKISLLQNPVLPTGFSILLIVCSSVHSSNCVLRARFYRNFEGLLLAEIRQRLRETRDNFLSLSSLSNFSTCQLLYGNSFSVIWPEQYSLLSRFYTSRWCGSGEQQSGSSSTSFYTF